MPADLPGCSSRHLPGRHHARGGFAILDYQWTLNGAALRLGLCHLWRRAQRLPS